MEPFVHLDPALEALPDDPRLAEPMRALCGAAEIALFTDKLNFKRPGGAPFPWHQDSPYFAFECPHVDRLVQSCLMEIDRHGRVVRSEFHDGIINSTERMTYTGVNGILTDRDPDTDVDRVLADARKVPVEAPAGSAIFFHGDVVHGSRSNKSAASRRASILTYQPGGHAQFRRPGVREIKSAV